ncbi:MAG TPA: thermopsin family protease [Thermoplasmata archaeon]|nr:thermopsin family protease [Thermoplasmata archaeon]
MPRRSRAVATVVLLVLLAVSGAGFAGLALPSHGVGVASSSAHSAVHAPPPAHQLTHQGRSAAPMRTPAHVPGGHAGSRPDRATPRVRPLGASPLVFPPNPIRSKVAPGAPSASSVYPTTPAPMGVSDFGVGAAGNYTYGTASFEGNLTLTSFSAFTPANTTNLSYPTPDWVLLQLDAVAVNVSLPPAASTVSNGTFWVQNGLLFNGSHVQLEDNIWNFTTKGAVLPPSTLTGLHGSILSGEVYAGLGANFSVTLPLTIELFDNISTSASNHTVIQFGYSIEGHGATYDTVTFNGHTSVSSPSEFRVNGGALVPGGLLYDAEFVLGGAGAGTNADLVGLNGSTTLLSLNGTGYQPVRAAFDYGEDASETALGVAVAYTGTTVRLTAGPSFLVGLWNTNGTVAHRLAPFATPGWIEVRITTDPSYAMVFATNASLAAGPLTLADYSYAPTTVSGDLTTDLPLPAATDPYVFAAWADGYASGNVTVKDNSTVVTPDPLTLTPAASVLDAPVYLRGSTQAQAFGEAHIDQTGYFAAGGVLWLNASKDLLAAPFLRVNERDFPTFTLLAALQVNVSVISNGFVQSPMAYNYTNEAGATVELTNWSQGYFFYYGHGHFAVENTSIEGSTALVYHVPPTLPPSTVEFYHTSGETVANLTVSQDAFGVTLDGSSSAKVSNLAAASGSVGVLAVNASTVTIAHASASGLDPGGFGSVIANLVRSSSVTGSSLSVSNSAVGIEADLASSLTISDLTTTSGATGLDVNDSGSGTVTGLTVGPGAGAGNWNNSSGLSFASVVVSGTSAAPSTGLNLSHDTTVTVAGGSAQGSGSTVVNDFNGSSHGTFRDLKANDSALALELSCASRCFYLNASSITATNASVGTNISNASSVSGTGYTSSGESVGLHVNDTTTVTFSGFTTSNLSLGADVNGSNLVKLAYVNASNATFNASQNFSSKNPQVPGFPVAGVAVTNDTNVTVTSVSATDYPFGVFANNASLSNVSRVTSWYGGVAVQFNNSTRVNVSETIGGHDLVAVLLNYTNLSKVTEVFAFADALGIAVWNCTQTTVATSTLEISAGPGVEIQYGGKDTVEENNFVGNNDSSVAGTFNASHLQAFANNTTSPTFEHNYWADQAGSAAYVVNATAPFKDLTPLGGFASTYLEFVERGLPLHWNWTITLGSLPYTTNVSVLYIPGWAISTGALPFTVTPIPFYPPHPSSGSVGWAGSSITQTIVFGATSSPSSGLPLWLIVTVAAAAGVSVAVVLLLRRRRTPRRPTFAPPAGSALELPTQAQR